jgi:hypothetical protein
MYGAKPCYAAPERQLSAWSGRSSSAAREPRRPYFGQPACGSPFVIRNAFW